ncbi:MAG: sn-glycerol-3-phosphate ABC transporter ATP-binding protein UgpC [Alphaproteobacteria bacterium]|nr:sn-glycerol-3-phosphate ABC transporter ATP-binding protein UgpC [Alphaproteobacteria bacterium]
MAQVNIQNIEKFFGETEVLKNISLSIEDGEFLVLVGPSGCGKSTLLRMIAGLEDITVGDISIGDKVVNNLPPKERDISMVFQNYALYPHLTVAQNMGFSLMLARAPKAEQERRVNEVAVILGLTNLLERKPKQLSGGQRQRVAMGRAIVRDPKVYLFDEPLSNLDAKLRVAMRAEIKLMHQKIKTTSVYVTHDQVEAMTMANRIAVMNAGRIEQIGKPLEIYDNPKNVFVAGFIGTPSMNLLAATVDLSGNAPLAVLSADLSLPLPLDTDLKEGQKITYGIRPEHLNIASNGAPVKVNVIEPTGSETHLMLSFGEESLVLVARDRVALSPGEMINVAPDLSRVMIFDLESGDRI